MPTLELCFLRCCCVLAALALCITRDASMNRGRGAQPGSSGWAQVWLLGAAVLITVAGWCVVDEVVSHRIGGQAWWYLGTYAVLWSLAWAVCGWLAPAVDRLLLPGSAVLNGLGLVMIHRIDLAEHAHYGSGAATDAPQQLLWTLVALVGFAGVLVIVHDYRSLARHTYTAGLAGVVLLLVPAMLPARISEVNGAKLWIRVAGSRSNRVSSRSWR